MFGCRFAEYKDSKVDWILRKKSRRPLRPIRRMKDISTHLSFQRGQGQRFRAHKLKYKYGMHPLTVTWSPHLYTDPGWMNLQSGIHVGGLDNILGSPNGHTHRNLTKLAFEILGDPFQPFIYGQTNFPLAIAANFNIPLLMYGENGEVEYGGDMKNAFIPTRDYRTDHRSTISPAIAPEDMVHLRD